MGQIPYLALLRLLVAAMEVLLTARTVVLAGAGEAEAPAVLEMEMFRP